MPDVSLSLLIPQYHKERKALISSPLVGFSVTKYNNYNENATKLLFSFVLI